MKFNLLVVGKIKDQSYQKLCEKYLKRLKHLTPLNLTEIMATKVKDKKDKILIQKKEAQLIKERIKPASLLILLDEEGKRISTHNFAKELSMYEHQSYSEVVWIIGGSLGVHEEIKNLAQQTWRLSDLTLAFELARLIFLEQFYRAVSINHHLPYHNE